MDTSHSHLKTRFKVGIFTLLGLVTIGALTVVVNDKPNWWRSCEVVQINIEDATGLKTKSPIRSLGIDIGYLQTVGLSETHVSLGICITEDVEILPTTRAYIRAEGFLGDKFVELKPVKYVGKTGNQQPGTAPKNPSKSPRPGRGPVQPGIPSDSPEPWPKTSEGSEILRRVAQDFQRGMISNAWAIDEKSKKIEKKASREIPVGKESQDIQQVVSRVDELVQQMTGLTQNIKQSINPDEFRKTMSQLNRALENASKTLAPEGGLTQTAQRSLAKLEDAIDQLRSLMTRVNKGEGSIGMLLNDPSYAQDLREAIHNVNRFLTRVGAVRFRVNVGAVQVSQYNGGRAWFHLGIWPEKNRYYLLGISVDPRGRISNVSTTATANGYTYPVETRTVDQTGILLTGMLGKIFYDRLDLSVGALYGDGAFSIGAYFGRDGYESQWVLRGDVYFRNSASPLDLRTTLLFHPFGEASKFAGLYLMGGLESIRSYPTTGNPIFFYGAGIAFNDEDIKILFTLR